MSASRKMKLLVDTTGRCNLCVMRDESICQWRLYSPIEFQAVSTTRRTFQKTTVDLAVLSHNMINSPSLHFFSTVKP